MPRAAEHKKNDWFVVSRWKINRKKGKEIYFLSVEDIIFILFAPSLRKRVRVEPLLLDCHVASLLAMTVLTHLYSFVIHILPTIGGIIYPLGVKGFE